MTFAILKLSYNNPGDSTLEGGICGSGFFISNSIAITAHHVLNEKTFSPNMGYSFSHLWMLFRNGRAVSLQVNSVQLYPGIDTSVISLRQSITHTEPYSLCLSENVPSSAVISMGYIGNSMPQIHGHWKRNIFVIESANLDSVLSDRRGSIIRTRIFSVDANDVKIESIQGFELSFGSRIGMSGGPLISEPTNEVIGLLSFGLPVDSDVKTNTFAVSIREIIGRIKYPSI